jgi:hypothetical protein
VIHSCLRAQVPARFGQAVAVAPSLLSSKLSAQFGRTGRFGKAAGRRRRRAERKPWVTVSACEGAKTSRADNAKHPADFGAAAFIRGPVPTRAAAKPADQVSADVVARGVEGAETDATRRPERPTAPVELPCACLPDIFCHQVCAGLRAQRAQGDGWFEEHSARIDGKGHDGTVGVGRRLSTELGSGGRRAGGWCLRA